VRLFIYGGNYFNSKTRKGAFYDEAYVLTIPVTPPVNTNNDGGTSNNVLPRADANGAWHWKAVQFSAPAPQRGHHTGLFAQLNVYSVLTLCCYY
jgi:hypothetical protein